jgi:hypothetical protein
MLDQTLALPEDPEELRSFTARLLAEVKAQAILIEKLRHQLAGHRAHRFGASSETAEQLQLALETSEIAAAAMTARMKLPDIEENGKSKRRPIPDHIPRMEVELTPGSDACAECGGRLRRIGEDVTEELEYVPGRFIVNRIVRPRLTCSCCERFVKRRCRRGPSSAVALGRVCWPRCWSTNTPIICHFIGKARSLTAKDLISTDRPWLTGSARPPACWNPWLTPSAAMFCQPRRSSPMTRP